MELERRRGKTRGASKAVEPAGEAETPASREKQSQLNALLEFLRVNRGFDFTGYKRTTFERRLEKRMQEIGKTSYEEYRDHLEVDPAEFGQLFDTLLINVTAFFRDPPAWEYLGSEIVPKILESKRGGAPVRVWSAGCSSGEEPCTLAMVLCEALGPDGFHERVKIYATDADEGALARARSGTYSENSLNAVPQELRGKYFQKSQEGYTFRSDTRRAIIYGRHDLIQDAPISKLDLLVCRNTLMYLNSETQSGVLSRFNYALLPTGFLFLGRAEMMLSRASLFQPVDLKHRVFSKVLQRQGDGKALQAYTLEEDAMRRDRPEEKKLRYVAFDTGPVPQLMVDRHGMLSLANQRARTAFGITTQDVGRPFQDLELSYRPVDLRSPTEQALAERRMITIANVERYTPGGDPQYLDIHVVPLLDGGEPMGVSIVFNDVTSATGLRTELARTNHQLEAASEELQSANEELETTNEELQSANEELETTNEELQSANEELETMNEELQSSNEELQTLNDELRVRSEEVGRSSSFLESILKGMQGGVIVTNTDFAVQVWNRVAEDMWGLRADEVVKQPLFSLDIGLPLDQLRDGLREALDGKTSEVVVDATNRRGKSFRCRVTSMPCAGTDGRKIGVMILTVESAAPDGGAEEGRRGA